MRAVFTKEVKRGSSYLMTCTYELVDTSTDPPTVTPVDISDPDFLVASTIRDAFGAVVAQCAVTKSGTTGQFRLRVDASAVAAWPVTRLQTDIRYTYPDGTVDKTPTWYVQVTQDETANA